MNRKAAHWTNASVRQLAGDHDPVSVIVEMSRKVVYDALEKGWSGPPFEPFDLAELLGLEVTPKEDVRDARTVPVGRGRVRLEYNPNRPLHRIRYSIAHEIGHTLFPDCAEIVRNRSAYDEALGDSWQIEALCNIAAAELLMPAATLADLDIADATIDDLMELRTRFGVSAEALLIRLAELADHQCLMFCASTKGHGARYRIDYAISSAQWAGADMTGVSIPTNSAVAECTAIGFTARRTERWHQLQKLHIECVGIPPYPGSTVPRVVGLALPEEQHTSSRKLLTYVTGDATRPRGTEPVIVTHVVNDAAVTWGGNGFAMALKRTWPTLQAQFSEWANQGNLSLGRVHLGNADPRFTVATIVAQKGYGDSKRPRLRYAALREGLLAVADHARTTGKSVHMPRIGTGQAGGAWDVVVELIKETICARGVPVVVYSLPNSSPRRDPQAQLPFFSD